jgi:NAD(P)-dependent dehydrogenase (short-subunit alcohol dehydrogenase family)
MAVGCDVADEDSVRRAADRVLETLGPADVLINNAAVLDHGGVLDMDLAVWNRILAVNLTGQLLCARAFGALMTERGSGSIVSIASIGGHLPQPHGGAYSVSKAGARMLSQVIAVELGGQGIRSNVVSPGMVITPMSEHSYVDTAVKAKREQMVPSARIGSAHDIADAVLWLASPRASYVNGEEILVDGALQRSLLSLTPRAQASSR